MWWSILGCEQLQKRSPVSYSEYLQAKNGPLSFLFTKEPVDSSTSDTIDRDLARTFPNHKKRAPVRSY